MDMTTYDKRTQYRWSLQFVTTMLNQNADCQACIDYRAVIRRHGFVLPTFSDQDVRNAANLYLEANPEARGQEQAILMILSCIFGTGKVAQPTTTPGKHRTWILAAIIIGAVVLISRK